MKAQKTAQLPGTVHVVTNDDGEILGAFTDTYTAQQAIWQRAQEIADTVEDIPHVYKTYSITTLPLNPLWLL